MNLTENHKRQNDQIVFNCPECDFWIGLQETLLLEQCASCSHPLEIHVK